MRDAVRASTTWGDLRARLSEERKQQVAESFGDDQQPADGVALADELMPGWDDGDWPEAPVQTMLAWVPEDVQRPGSEVATRLSREHLKLASGRLDEIVAAMQAAGHVTQRDDALVKRAA